MHYKTFLAISFLFFCQLSLANNTQSLQKALEKARIENHVIGMQMTVILPNEEKITVTSGNTEKNQDVAIRSNTLFQIGSETKSFTAALLLKLEQQGKLKLTDTLVKYLPYYKQWSKVTLQQLLQNNSGIPNYSEDAGFQKLIQEKPDYQWQSPELIAFAAKQPMDFEPGKGWHYSNTNFILAGMVAEKVTGQTLENLYKINFLDKSALDLSSTYYLPTSYDLVFLARMAHGYDEQNKDITTMNMSWAGAAGAMVSNSTDLAKWAFDLFHGRAIAESELQKMMQLVSTTTGLPVVQEDKEGYGMGIGMRTTEKFGKWYGHEGETLGYHAIFLWFPESDLTVAILANGPATKLKDFAITVPGLLSNK